jgi:hypothetical protein
MRALTYGRHAAIVLVALGTVACTALLGDFNVGADGSSSGNPGEGGLDEAGALTITPADVKVGVLRGLTFIASQPVTWAIQEGPSGGIVDDAGKYTAPDKPGVVHVVATSKADPAMKATATVTVAPIGLSILTGSSGGEGNIDGGPLRAHFRQPAGVAHLFDNTGSERYFIADTGNHTIRMFDTVTQKVSTIAGTPGTPGRTNGVGPAALFKNPRQLIADRNRNTILINDNDGTCIRELDPSTATVTTVTGQCGTAGGSDGGPGVSAQFERIRSFDVNGGKFSNEAVTALFVCDGSQRIRRVSLAGASKGVATTMLTTSGCDLATDLFSGGSNAKDVYFLDSTTLKRVHDLPPYTAQFVAPAPEFYSSGIGIGSGQGPEALFMLSESKSVVYRIAPLTSSAFETNPFLGAFDDQRVIDGPFMTARLGRPNGIDVITERGNGSLLFADNAAAAIRMADFGQKKVSTFLGAARMQDRVDGPRSTARMSGPFAITSDATGIYFTDLAFDGPVLNNTIRKVDATGAISTVAGKPTKPSTTVPPVDGTKDEATFGFPIDLAFLKGNLYVVDLFGAAVRKVTLAGDVTTLAGELGVQGPATDAVGGAAHFKFADLGPDGSFGGGIATDGTDLFVSDSANFAIRKISVATGQVTLIAGGTSGTANGVGKAAQFMNPFGLAYDNGSLYIADAGDNTIRRLDLKTNEVTGFMGLSGLVGEVDGDAAMATFHTPSRLQADGAGNLFVASIPFGKDKFLSGVIRRINIKTRTVSTYAGVRGRSGLAPGPLPSTLNCPLSFTLLPGGDLAFADFCDAAIAVFKPL